MRSLKRRSVLGGLGAVAWAGMALPAGAQKPAASTLSKPALLAPSLRIVIPANPGGGWDQTGRALGVALVGAGVTEEVSYENMGGKGGTIGLAHYVEKYSNDPNTLLMGGSVMVGAVALQKPAVDMSRIHPIGRLTSDYLVVVVAANSPIRSIKALAERMKAAPQEVPIAGGGSGGVDHVFSGVFARATGIPPEALVYLPFASGPEVVQAVMSGKAVAGVSGYSEFSDQLASGKLRAIGVSSKRAVFGIPAIREQGVNVDMSNWRGVFTGQGVTAQRQVEMAQAVKAATTDASWQKILNQNHWESSWLSGPSFKSFIEFDATTFSVMVGLLKLKV